jgi:SprT protein
MLVKLPPEALRKLRTWLQTWGAPGLPLQVLQTSRLRRARGRCDLRTQSIEIRPDILSGGMEELIEVLCHEAAHLAVFSKYGSAARPHGAEWQSLLGAVGMDPRKHRFANCRIARIRVTDKRAPAARYDHVCPVCQMHRSAKRPVRQWRCARCVAAGLGGSLVITRSSGAVTG